MVPRTPRIFPSRVDRDRDLPVLVALLGRRQEMLAAVLVPFHRAAELHRRRRDHRLLGIERRLGAEAAADVGRDHADRFEIALEQVGERAAAEMRRLRRRPDREHVGRRRRSSPAPRAPPASCRRRDACQNLFLEHVRRARRRRHRRRRSSSARTAATLSEIRLCARGAPGFTASRQSLDRRQRLVVDLDRAAASSAMWRLSAITTATVWPT